jgi:hypothetical protein
MTDALQLAHSDLVTARSLVVGAGQVQWTGPASDRFRTELDDAAAAVAALAADIAGIGPPRPWAVPIVRSLL